MHGGTRPTPPPRAMRSPRLVTFALVRDPRLPHLLRSLLADLWRGRNDARRRLVIATSFEEVGAWERSEEVEAALVEIRDEKDLLRLAGARESVPGARVVAVPSSLLLTPLASGSDELVAQVGSAVVLGSLDDEGLRTALGAERLDQAV